MKDMNIAPTPAHTIPPSLIEHYLLSILPVRPADLITEPISFADDRVVLYPLNLSLSIDSEDQGLLPTTPFKLLYLLGTHVDEVQGYESVHRWMGQGIPTTRSPNSPQQGNTALRQTLKRTRYMMLAPDLSDAKHGAIRSIMNIGIKAVSSIEKP